MSDQPTAAAAPVQPASPAPPAEPQHEGWLGHVLHPGQQAAPRSAPSVLPAELAHLRGALTLAVDILEEPAFRPLVPKALELIVSAAGIAGNAL